MAKTAKLLALVLGLSLVATIFVWWHGNSEPMPHGVTLNWHPPPPKEGVTIVGYNIYRRAEVGGAFVKIADRVPNPPYEDTRVTSGRTYSYTVTSVDQSGRESRYSTVTNATIP